MTLASYENDGFYDEMFDADSRPRSGAAALIQRIAGLEEGELLRRQQAAEQALLNLGITFNVYGDAAGAERIFPFDIVPRIVAASDWSFIERGLKQRVQALNCFIDDIYHDQKIVGSGLVPADLIASAKGYLKPCLGLSPPQEVWCHINGTDLVRDWDGQLYVLEDNLRCPSGVSYVLENRQVLKRTFPQVFEASRVRPAPHCRTPILSYSLHVLPETHFLNWQQDPQSNYLARLVFPEATRELRVEVDLVAEMTVINPFDFFLEPAGMTYPFTYEPWLEQELRPYLEAEPAGPEFERFLAGIRREVIGHEPIATIDFLVQVNRRVQQAIDYIVRLEAGIQTCEETLTLRRGSCRDSAWLLLQLIRRLGLAARFVSGYLIQLTADEKPLDGPAGPAVDFTDLHAWMEVYLPGAGWVGLDPTSGLLAGEGHIPLACTPQASSAAPITGAVEPCSVDFDVSMSMTRVHEDPRVTKPYTEAQWQAIDTLGRRVDADLEAGDVRLTMGGEPTFVSIDDMDGEEWSTAAVGPAKRRLAAELLKRLKDRFAPGGLLHYGQGKWYPGESLPRWALACYWRIDGIPVWHNEALIGDETRDYGHTARDARNVIEALTDRLDVDSRFVLPAYEDVWTMLGRERHLPENLDPSTANLDDPEERERLARAFERGLGEGVGYVLPLDRRRFSPARWVSGPWSFRTGHLFLAPGDSPIGLRLPLDALPWMPPSCLHPTIPVHTPLTFDMVDTWNDRAIGGCSYHVTHPGGRHYETLPVNANEAESRRVSRFFAFGHTPGAVSIAPEDANPQFPYTLDLRR